MSRFQPKSINSKELSYEHFQATTDRFTTLLLLRAKTTYPYAKDPDFAKNLLLSGLRLFINEPQDELGKSAIGLFDVSYKLGLPLRPTLIQILKGIIAGKRKAEAYRPEVTYKTVFKRWRRLPLPRISHRERYEDGILESRMYRDSKGIKIEGVKETPLLGLHEGELLRDPSMRNLWRFLISVYAARKLNSLYDDYKSGEQPLALLHASSGEIAQEVENTNPVGRNGLPLKKMQWDGSQKRLAELFIVLERRRWIPAAVSGAIQRAFNPSTSMHDFLKPGTLEKSNKRVFPNVYTPEYSSIFDCIPDNPDKFSN